MATIAEMYENWCTEEIRWGNQVNDKIWLAWFNKWMLIFQKMILEYVSGKQNLATMYTDIQTWESEYDFPLGFEWVPDFYSIIQLRVAYKTDKNDVPLYRVCNPINLTDYNIKPVTGKQIWEPMVMKRLSKLNPWYHFISKNKIKIYPTPDADVDNWLCVSYNFIEKSISYDEAFWVWDEEQQEWTTPPLNLNTLNLPWYFFDAIDDYITFRLYQAENPEQAQWYYQQFESTLHDNIYWLNKDKRPIDEWFADLRYFYHY